MDRRSYRRVSRLILGVLVSAVAFAPSLAFAAVEKMDLDDLSRAADAVVVVKVGGAATKDASNGRTSRPDIVTEYDLHVTKVIAGERPSGLRLVQPGGTIGDVTLNVSDLPNLVKGEEAVLFLDEQQRVIGGYQGKLKVENGQVNGRGLDLETFGRQVRQYRAAGRSALWAKVGVSGSSETAAIEPVLGEPAVPVEEAAVAAGISAISPSKQIAGIGRTVTISGSGFGSTAGKVEFTSGLSISQAYIAATVKSWSDTSIVAEVPGNTASGLVRVTTAVGSAPTKSYDVSFSTAGRSWATLPLNYYINENTGDMSGEGAEILKTFTTWNSAGSAFRIGYAGATSRSAYKPAYDGMSDIFFSSLVADGVVGINHYWVSSGKIIESDIALNDKYTWAANASSAAHDVQTIVLHEIGHAVGLNDQYPNTWRVMGAAVRGTNRRALTADEKAGAVYLYGGGTVPPATSDSITRVDGRDRYAVADIMARAAFPNFEGVKYVVIASGEDRAAADPLAAAGLAGAYDAPVLLVSSRLVDGKLPSPTEYAINAIKQANGGSVRFLVVGGGTTIPSTVYNRLSALKGTSGTIARINGADRYALSAEIAGWIVDRVGIANVPGVMIANGQDSGAFFDALAASPISFKTHMPLLLVQRGAVPYSTGLTLSARFTGKPRIVVNSTGWVSNGVYTAVGASGNRMATTTDRATSAAQIANRALAEKWLAPLKVAVANKLPDALTGGAAIGRLGGPLLYTEASALPPVTNEWLNYYGPNMERVYLVGGEISITPAVYSSVKWTLE